MRHAWTCALWALALLPTLALGGCRVGPGATAVEFGPQLNPAYLHARARAEVPPAADLAVWWEGFADPTLTALVERALLGNLDLAAARERVVAARARRGVQDAQRLPTLDANAGYSYAKTGEEAISFNGAPPGVETDLYTLGAVAGWELDLWGRVARLVEAADANIAFAAEDFRALRVSLAATVAREVLGVRAIDGEIATVQAGILADRDVLSIAEARGAAGLSDSLAAAQARRVLAADLAELPALRGAREAALLRLAALLGEAPGAVEVPSRPNPAAGEVAFFGVSVALPDAGVPADLLLRRPDIRRAAAEVDGAAARVGAAVAGRYPRVTLGGSIALQGPDLGDAVNFDARVVQAGPRVVLPLWEGGRLAAGVEQARARQREALAVLRAAVVEAQREVEVAAALRTRAAERVDRLGEAVAAAEDTETLARDRYAAGAADFLSVTEAVTARLAIERRRVLAERETLLRLVDLYAALGGGW